MKLKAFPNPLKSQRQQSADQALPPPPRRPLKSPDIEYLFAILADQSPDAVLRIDHDGTILYGNACAAEFFDLDPSHIAGANIHEICRRMSCGGFWQSILEQTCTTGTPQHGHTLIQGKNGPRFLEIRTARESNGGQHFDAIVSTIRDTTARHIHERQLQEANQRLLYHMNNSPLAVIEWDTSGQCLSWNDEAEHLFGWTRSEASHLFEDCLPLVHIEDRQRFLKIYENLRSGRETSAFTQSRTISSNNAISWCEWYLSSLIDDSGKSLSILCLVNDVTERELSERKLQTLTAALEKKIEFRSQLLRSAKDDLRREHLVRRQLERDMIGVSERAHRRIGHDLHDGICQELAGVRFAIAAMAASAEKNTPVHQRLLDIEAATLRAMHETRLLARGLAPMELDSGDLASSLRELSKNSARLHSITCSLRWRGPKIGLPSDTATHLFRIAQEAVHNSIQHGAATAVTIRFAVNRRSLRLTVDDNGSGLPTSPKPHKEGRGMGHKIMQHRASVLQGHITLIPHPKGKGARLVCSLPHPTHEIPCQTPKSPHSKS